MRRRLAFTLLELLVVIGIISILAGMILAVTVSIREKAREQSTASRMDNITRALLEYGTSSQSIAATLQANLELGGVDVFASIKVINQSIAPACAKPPGFVQYVYSGSWSSSTFTATNYNANSERKSLWMRLTEQVMDVQPQPTETWAAGDYELEWPAQWPETDWMAAVPGTVPPVLRFPWGKPGLRIDGSLCDPAVAEGTAATTENMVEQMGSGGKPGRFVDGSGNDAYVESPIANSWVTYGANGASPRIWTWSSNNTAQTDWVDLTVANRSDGTAAADLSAAKPLPFDLGWCSPLKTMRLLQAASVLASGSTGEDAYRTNRNPSQMWNDAWGNPLVVVYALYQPERYRRTFDGQNRRDLLLRGALKAYQYNRSVYLAVGATGPTLPTGLSRTWAAADDRTALRDFWLHIRDVADAADWDEGAFVKAPWAGTKVGKQSGLKAMVTGVTEVK